MINVFLVGLGAAFGGLTRYILSTWLNRKKIGVFPYTTFLINLSGSFFLGFFLGMGFPLFLQLLLGIGFMGGFTTFSTFKIENIQLYFQKKFFVLFMYIVFSYLFGILFAAFGFFTSQKII